MARKDISDLQVVNACLEYKQYSDMYESVIGVLIFNTGECLKVCYRAMERAYKRGYIECGVSLRTAWITDKGRVLYDSATLVMFPYWQDIMSGLLSSVVRIATPPYKNGDIVSISDDGKEITIYKTQNCGPTQVYGGWPAGIPKYVQLFGRGLRPRIENKK